MPDSIQDLQECEMAYRIAGFPGCIGSTDATHIPLERVAYIDRQQHLGFKSSATTRTYNLTVNHKRQILHSTTGHPGCWNDKTLVRFDSFMDELRKGAFGNMMTFELMKASCSHTNMNGAYVIVDNGYLNWSTTVPPLHNSMYRSEIRFSQWLESLRKDVECTFGILKGRWRILKTGIRLHNTAAADNVWLTCCALHNLLLDVDGLSNGWQNGIPSHWESTGGQFEVRDMPIAIQRLINPLGTNVIAVQTYDRTKFGFRPQSEDLTTQDDEDDNTNNNFDTGVDDDCIIRDEESAGRSVSVNTLSLKRFRSMLIEHLNVVFYEQKVVWPTRLTARPRDVPAY